MRHWATLVGFDGSWSTTDAKAFWSLSMERSLCILVDDADARPYEMSSVASAVLFFLEDFFVLRFGFSLALISLPSWGEGVLVVI